MADSPSPFEPAIMPVHLKPHRDEEAELRHQQAELQMQGGIDPTRTQRAALLLIVWCHCATAATINVTTNDNYTKIEAAKAGDQVLIAPGTYGFRVYLTGQATPTNPIVIAALDPSHPPAWDFGTNLVENAPGSYTAGDRGRGGWQFSGAQSYNLSGIVFRHCRTASFNSAGIRYYNGTTNLYLRDCVFYMNDNGLTGGTQDSEATVEFCEFNANGNTNASLSSPTHNLYVYGGYLTLRYCYVHDSVQGQNFHIRCRSSTLEYNWFARANNYEGDLMSDDDFSGPGPFAQTMTLRGNIFVQNNLPGNNSQVVALYNDARLANLTLSLRMLYNTFVGANMNSAFVHVSNAIGTQMNAEVSDNIIFGTKTAVLIEDTNAAAVTGLNNWLQTNAATGPLTGSVQSASPGFRNPAANDYTLTSASACIGVANVAVYGLAGREYFQNEITNRMWRIRASAQDIGAFESTSTNTPVGPYDPSPLPQLTIQRSEANVLLSWPLFAQDFQLYQSALNSPVTWSPAPNTYVTNAMGLSATSPVNVDRYFFRLQK
jgi:hypothetical protein